MFTANVWNLIADMSDDAALYAWAVCADPDAARDASRIDFASNDAARKLRAEFQEAYEGGADDSYLDRIESAIAGLARDQEYDAMISGALMTASYCVPQYHFSTDALLGYETYTRPVTSLDDALALEDCEHTLVAINGQSAADLFCADRARVLGPEQDADSLIDSDCISF